MTVRDPGLTPADWDRIRKAARVIRDHRNRGDRTDGGVVANELLPEGEFIGKDQLEPHWFTEGNNRGGGVHGD